MLPASVWFVHDRVDGLELGPDVLVVDGLELVNELELGPDVLAVDGLELVNAILVLVHKYIATCTTQKHNSWHILTNLHASYLKMTTLYI